MNLGPTSVLIFEFDSAHDIIVTGILTIQKRIEIQPCDIPGRFDLCFMIFS